MPRSHITYALLQTTVWRFEKLNLIDGHHVQQNSRSIPSGSRRKNYGNHQHLWTINENSSSLISKTWRRIKAVGRWKKLHDGGNSIMLCKTLKNGKTNGSQKGQRTRTKQGGRERNPMIKQSQINFNHISFKISY